MKEYELFKSMSKTAKINNLEIAEFNNIDENLLFDFSYLSNLPINDNEKMVIKDKAKRYVAPCFTDLGYSEDFSEYEYCIGFAHFHSVRVFSELNGRLNYSIMVMDCIKHYHYERNNIFNDYKLTEIKDNNFECSIDKEI